MIWIFLLSCNGFAIMYFIFNLNCIMLYWIIIWIMNIMDVLLSLRVFSLDFYLFSFFFLFFYKNPRISTGIRIPTGTGTSDRGQNPKWGWGRWHALDPYGYPLPSLCRTTTIRPTSPLSMMLCGLNVVLYIV